jgi:uncharacterized protein YutE (UPF0331/DUF86 family)
LRGYNNLSQASFVMKIIQIVITIFALSLAAVHIFLPNLKIDAITITLVVIAIIPWLAPLIKTLEFPGGWKVEFSEKLKKVEIDVEKAGLIDEQLVGDIQKYSFTNVADSNVALMLAGLRIELEKSLKVLAKCHNIELHRYNSIAVVIIKLHKLDIISDEEQYILNETIGILNRAVHGEYIDYQEAQRVKSVGLKVLGEFEKKIIENKLCK